MMTKTLKTLISAAVLCTSVVATPALSATIGHEQTFCESQRLSVFGNADCDLGGRKDLSNRISRPDSLSFLGSGTLGGFVADGRGVGNGDFPDYAYITLASDSVLTMTLIQPGKGFDALFSFGDLIAKPLSQSDLSVSFAATAGTYLFGIDATRPSDSASYVGSSYSLDVVAVPIPAGMVLMLTSLGGLALARRRQKA